MLAHKNELLEKGETADSMVVTLDMTYDYVKLGEILSLQLNIYSYSGGAHGSSQLISITTNTSTGEIYEYNDLFKDNVDNKQVITGMILKEIEKDPESYFPDYKETIMNKDGNYDFYIDGDKLVVYFGLYDIAPYAAGIRYFPIDSEEIKEILEYKVYNSIKDGKERGPINYNGKDIKSNKGTIINNDYIILVPLRVIAESLGYKVDWNREDGPIVGARPVTITPRKVIDGTTYVPLSYFKDVLAENVSLGNIGDDKLIVRAFSKDSRENNLSLMKDHASPIRAEDAVKMYAEAVKMRNGMVQYALLDQALREEKYEEFKNLGFVTGTSSPWVESYEINKLEENLFKITFTSKTSVPTDLLTTDVIVGLTEEGQYLRIKSIEE